MQPFRYPTPRLTPIQRKMLAILADGLPHTRRELHACLYDQASPLSNIQQHLSGIRAALRDEGGPELICLLHKSVICYRLVLPIPVNGRA